jgi:hypothetical protein
LWPSGSSGGPSAPDTSARHTTPPLRRLGLTLGARAELIRRFEETVQALFLRDADGAAGE